jgi:hypothetical protein
MRRLRTLERKYIPNLRHKKGYKTIKKIVGLLFIPFILPIYFIKKGIMYLASKVRIKRSGIKPDIILSNIIAGWANLAFPSERVEKVAMQRASICSTCPHAVMLNGTHTITVDGVSTNVKGMKCDMCGCPLSAKIRALEDRCPIGKW